MTLDEQKWLRMDWDKGWQIVMPDLDIEAHGHPKGKEETELAGMDCPCGPKVNYLDKIIVHESFLQKKMVDDAMTNHL